MLLRKISIKSKFYIIVGLFIVAFAITGIVISVIIGQITKHGDVAKELSNIKSHYTEMKFAEYKFLVGYEKNIDFFATGKSEELEIFDKQANKILEIVDKAKENEITQNFISIAELNSIENALKNYMLLFEELLLKISEKGIDNYGLKARLEESFIELKALNTEPEIDEFFDKLKANTTQYFKSQDKISYNRFLENFEELRIFITGDKADRLSHITNPTKANIPEAITEKNTHIIF